MLFQNILYNLFAIVVVAHPHNAQEINLRIIENSNEVSSKGTATAFHGASKRKYTEKAKSLIENGIGLRFLLYCAIIKGDTETVSLLFEKGAEADAKTPKRTDATPNCC